MSRLIDADALIDTMEFHVTTMSVCSTTIEARAKGEMKRTCISDVANAPTIPAIPVDWIRKYADTVGSRVRAEIVREMLDVWEKEQEAQDGAKED